MSLKANLITLVHTREVTIKYILIFLMVFTVLLNFVWGQAGNTAGHYSHEFLLYDSLLQSAFDLAPLQFSEPVIRPCPELDPPVDSKPESTGLVYQECLAITCQNDVANGHDFYAKVRPRCGLDRSSFNIFLFNPAEDQYDLLKWSDVDFKWDSHVIQPLLDPAEWPDTHAVALTDYSELLNERGIRGRPVYCALENRDQTAGHYTAYKDAQYLLRSSDSILLKSMQLHGQELQSTFRLHEDATDSEYIDNIVLNLAAFDNLPAAKSPGDSVHVDYSTYAYWPADSDGDGLTDHFEILAGSDTGLVDTDGDSLSDYEELLLGTPPLIASVESGSDPVPQTPTVLSVYPNPFNAAAALEYTLHRQQRVRIKVYNSSGQYVNTLIDEQQPAGR